MTFTVYGPAYSTYARTVRLALEEKDAGYDLVEVDMLSGAHQQPEHLARQPFGPVPAFEHDGFVLYETDAIIRYIDDVVEGPMLEPRDPRDRARMNQIIGINDSYGYPAIILKLFWQRAVVPMMGGQADEAIVAAALPRTRLVLSEIERIMGGSPWLAGSDLSLADVMVAPVMAYLHMTPEANTLMAERPKLAQWWQTMSARPSMQRTAPKLG
jgi:glutathione S-transferase